MKRKHKWSKEIAELSKRRYKQMDGELYNYYKDALKELKIEVNQYLKDYDKLTFSQRMQVDRQLQVARQVDEILTDLSGKATETVDSFVRDELQLGYNSVWYTVESMEKVQLNFSMLPENYIEQLVNQRVDGKNFSERLYDYREELADHVTDELLRGARRGEGYAKVAKRVGELTEASYKQALRIAETEGGRTQSAAKQKSYEEAEQLGVRIQKQWIATLDEKTRSSHADLDGQIVDIDDYFTSSLGNKALGPNLFGVAEEDIRCRCSTLTVVNGISPTTRLNNITDEVIDYESYEEWAADRL